VAICSKSQIIRFSHYSLQQRIPALTLIVVKWLQPWSWQVIFSARHYAWRGLSHRKSVRLSVSLSQVFTAALQGGWNDLQMSSKVIERGTNRKLVYELLLLVYSNFCRITHRDISSLSCFDAVNHIFAYSTCIWPWIWRSPSCRWNVETKFGARKLE